MFVLNYFYFCVINVLLLWSYGRKSQKVVIPQYFHREVFFSGKELAAILLFSTGVFAFAAPAGLDLMAIRLLILELFCILWTIHSKNKPVINFTVCLYLIFIVWLIFGCVFSDYISYGIRTIFKFLYLILAIILFSTVCRRKEFVITCFIWARRVSFASVLVSLHPYVQYVLLKDVFWYGTALAINYITILVISLVLYFHEGKHKLDLLYALAFMIPCIIWSFRTSILGASLAIMVFCFYRYRLASLVPISLIFFAIVGVILMVPSVREKTFFHAEDANLSGLSAQSLSEHRINTNGRSVVWEWALENHYEEAPYTGFGTGHLQGVFYSGNHPFGTIKIVHNDYIQLLCDNGCIGLSLFMLFLISFIIHSFFVYQSKKNSQAVRMCALIAGPSMAGVMLTLFTDNVINYSMCTIAYPAAVYGMMLGLLKVERRNRRAL